MSPVFGDQSPLLSGEKLDSVTLGMSPGSRGLSCSVKLGGVLLILSNLFLSRIVEWDLEGCRFRSEFLGASTGKLFHLSGHWLSCVRCEGNGNVG